MRHGARFQPGIDALERRELLTGSPAAAPRALELFSGLHAPAIKATAATQAVVQIKNLTNAPVTYTFRWSYALLGSTTTLLPGYTKIYWADLVDGLKAEIRFDRSSQPGMQEKFLNLAYAKFNGAGIPPASAAKTYAFQSVPGGINLTDKVTTRAVTGFKNASSSTVLFQFRWNSTSSWSPTIKLAPGKVQYFWTSLLNTTGPEVRYDQSSAPGWQFKTYGLGFNTFSGSGNPSFSSARVYTFRAKAGGVGLFS